MEKPAGALGDIAGNRFKVGRGLTRRDRRSGFRQNLANQFGDRFAAVLVDNPANNGVGKRPVDAGQSAEFGLVGHRAGF